MDSISLRKPTLDDVFLTLTRRRAASDESNGKTIVLVIALALLIGFRPTAGPLAWLAALGILVLYILAISWLGVIVGLSARSVEGASAFSFFVLFTPYVSSAFVPTETMPSALHFIADNQPYTPVIEAIRALTTGGSPGHHGWLALAWTGGITVISSAVAIYHFKRKATL